MRDHTSAVEADLLSLYGVDVRRLWTGELTYRQVFTYLVELPDDSRTRKKIAGPVSAWSQSEHLMACMVDQLATANWMYVSAHAAKASDVPPPPKAIPRPGDPEPVDVEKLSAEEKQKTIEERFGTAREQADKVFNLLGGMKRHTSDGRPPEDES